MRWDGQAIGRTDAETLPGLESPAHVQAIAGLVRTVRTPEFAGMTFHEVHAKSALNHVPSASAMPFDWTVNPYRGCSHACAYCVSPDTRILLASGRHLPISDLSIGDEIVGTTQGATYRHYTTTKVVAKWSTRKRAYRVTLADGTELIASGDHRFLTECGWKHVRGDMSAAGQRPYLTTQNRLQGFGFAGPAPITAFDEDFRRGYLSGMIRGDGRIFHKTYDDGIRVRHMQMFRLALADTEALDRTRDFLAAANIATHTRPFATRTEARREMTALHSARREDIARIEALIETPAERSTSWRAGFLSGIFDAEGSCSRGIARIANKDANILDTTSEALAAFGLDHVVEPARPNGVRCVRLRSGMPVRQRFFALTRPAITRKLDISGTAVKTVADLRVVAVEDLGYEMDMVDITTGTGDFVANGVISHNCFARNTHTYLDLDAGRDFDSQIVVKTNVAEVLRRELAAPSWRREPVALGTNTDPYQRAEGRYRLMPGIIDALAASGTPLSILTKGTLLRRDLPLLTDAAASVTVELAMSIAVFDDDLQQSIEPGTPTTTARLATVRAAADAGFRVTVFLMPILPHLTDSAPALDHALARIRDAGAARVVFGALHLRPGAKQWFWQWLEREHPDVVPAYRGLYPGASTYAPVGYRTLLAGRVRPLLLRHGLAGGAEEDAETRPARPGPVRTTSRTAAASALLF